MNKNSIIVALVALLVGIAIGWGASQLLVSSTMQAVSTSAQTEAASQQTTSSQLSNASSQGETGSGGASAQAADAQDESAQSSSLSGQAASQNAQQETNASQSTQQEESSSSQENDTSAKSDKTESSKTSSSTQSSSGNTDYSHQEDTSGSVSVVESGTYTSKDEVAAYIHEFGHLPSNFISKSKAKKAGWVSSKGNLDEVLPGMSIGGSEFYNNEGQLPDAPGRRWTECDINYEGGFRGAERIVFSDDGLIFYTADHYKTFEQLY